MMNKHKIGPAMRFFFLFSGSVIWIGIWLTGFSTVHWLLYVPAINFYFAAVTAICPGIIISRLMFRSLKTVKGDEVRD